MRQVGRTLEVLSCVALFSILTIVAADPVAFTVVDSDPNRPGVRIWPWENHIVRDSTGKIFVAYGISTNQLFHWYNYIRWSTDGGATWSGAVRTESMPDSSSVESLAIDGSDNLYEGFTFNVGSFFTKSTDSGQTWSGAVALHDGGWGAWDWQPSLVVDASGNLHVAYYAAFGWEDYPCNIIYKTSTDAGATWSAGVNLSNIPDYDSYGYGASGAALYAGKDGHLFVLYDLYISATDRSKWLVHFDGTSWSQPTKISTEGRVAYGGDLAVDSTGRVHIVFSEKSPDTDNAQLIYRTYDPAAKTLSVPRAITPNTVNTLGSSLGIYSGDKIFVAYDTYYAGTGKYGGVYVLTSTDDFATATKISTHPQAHSPSLRSALYFMNDPDKVDIVWVEPNDLTGGEDLVYAELSQGIKPPEALTTNIWAPYFVNPGGEMTILVEYKNTLKETAQDTVVTVHLPGLLDYLSCSQGGTYVPTRNEVFWKLGDVPSGTTGYLWVKLMVPWGLSNMEGNLFAIIAAKNVPSPDMDLDYYLDFTQTTVTSQQQLTETEIDELLESNANAKLLLSYALGLGCLYEKQVFKTTFSDGSSKVMFFMLDKDKTGPVILVVEGATAILEAYSGGKFSQFDAEGGYAVDLNAGTYESWGKWAETHSLSQGQCQWNCLVRSGDSGVMGWIASSTNAVSGTFSCTLCYLTGFCGGCIAQIAGGVLRHTHPAISKCVAACSDESQRDNYRCTEELRYCGTLGTFDPNAGIPASLYRPCNDGVYATFERAEACLNAPMGYQRCDPKTGRCEVFCLNSLKPGRTASRLMPGHRFFEASGTCRKTKFEVVPAHDPNAKSVDPTGDIVPGQRLTYAVEFENTGKGTAYSVFIIDKLDANLDESTLSIDNGGNFDPTSRLLTWEVGTVPPCDDDNPDICKGSVTFSVNVKADVPSGTEIVNLAEVHFPSAGEITPTNPVVNVVKAIAADPKTVQTTAGVAVPVVLSGRDSGGGQVTYRVTLPPSYGTLSGTAPNLTYTPMDNFVGQDDFLYVVNNGLVDSDPARVRVIVDANPADTTPPVVQATYPTPDATNVHVSAVSLFTDANRYVPTITATFSEQIDPATLTTDTFTVAGVTGLVEYNAQTRTAAFIPTTPLSASTVYTATVGPGITDLVGNVMATAYSWNFTTESPANIVVSLPDAGNSLEFGENLLNTPSAPQIVNVQSTGSLDLVLGNVTITGANAADFAITEDNCSSATLKQSRNAILKVVFQPTAAGRRDAELQIPSNDADTPTVKVPLRGTGVVFMTKPDRGTIGTRVTLTGAGFGAKKGSVSVGKAKCRPSAWSDTTISFTVAGRLKPGVYDITVTPAAKKPDRITRKGVFTVSAPVITALDPDKGGKGTKVTVTGSYFGANPGRVSLQYKSGKKTINIPCKPSQWKMDAVTGASQFVIVIPKGIPAGTVCDLVVANAVGSTKQAAAFTAE